LYSESIVAKTLQKFAAKNGWCPEPHTLDQVKEFNEYIESLIDTESNSVNRYFSWKNGKRPTDTRVKWIRRFIENEQFMCFASGEYFVTRYTKIRSADERIIEFQFRLGQKIFLSIMADCDDAQIAIQLFCLKARQVGISTCVAVFFLHRILFRSNTIAVMASVQQQQSEKLGKMIDTAWLNLPFWLPPAKKSLKTSEPTWANGSILSIQSGNQEVGIAQGTSPSAVHISEVGDYTRPKRVLEEGLFPACHQLSSLFMVLEGTGSTASPWQREKWDYYSQHDGRFKTIYIPPCCAPDLYPPSDWLRAHPIPMDWIPGDETMRMRRRGELYVRSTDYLWRFLGQHWEMDKEYMWYWESGYKEAVSSHSEKTFLSQTACSPEEAFQSKNDPVFTNDTITVVTKQRERAYKTYAITGRTILMGSENKPYEPNPDQIDWNEPRIRLRWEAVDGNKYEWELVPLIAFDDTEDANCLDRLFVFEPPMDGANYAIGVDTADGLGLPNEDRSTLSVHISYEGNSPDRQVASFSSNRVNSAQMSRIAAAVGVLFGTDGEGVVTSENPLIAKYVIEQVRKPGDECMHQLKIMGFLDHHIMIRYDQKGAINPFRGSKEGWFTGSWSRPILLDRFVNAVNTGWLILNDPIVLRQLATFVRKQDGNSGKSRMEHEDGQHDDNIFACAMAWTTMHDLQNDAERLENKFAPPRPKDQIDDRWASNCLVI
jgi:hypothetical protein